MRRCQCGAPVEADVPEFVNIFCSEFCRDKWLARYLPVSCRWCGEAADRQEAIEVQDDGGLFHAFCSGTCAEEWSAYYAERTL
ncbi:MAG: hypothetical protein C4555_04465 [Dehalococcoidia bacterium]|nr:MAG: hypothetical protein C4555_04465 [Dehalococcoidia bacterium]